MTGYKRRRELLLNAALFFLLFIALIFAVTCIDVQPIGPEGSVIGLASINAAVHGALGVNMAWYDLTEITGLIAIAAAAGFALLGMMQLFQRRSIAKVDRDLLLLGVFYAVVVCFYVLFEIVVINHRPVLMEGELEASFPSSHTMLAACIMGSAIVQFGRRISHRALRSAAIAACAVLLAVTVAGRLLSGVHWLTDILGGLLLSAALISAYAALCPKETQR